MIINNPNATQTFCQRAGDPSNPAILLLHGIGADHKMWAPQIDEFAGRGYFVLAPDLLGHGGSSKVETLELGDWNEQINHLLAHYKLESCILVGVSMGGVIAQAYAVARKLRNPAAHPAFTRAIRWPR